MKPKCRVKCVNWCLSGLYSAAQFLRGVLPKCPPYTIIEKKIETEAIYVIGTTLHVYVLHLCKKDELNLISLTMDLRLVDKVRINNFHLNHFFIARREHVHITSVHWEAIEFVLPYISRGPWVEHKGKRERVVKITFNDFLRLAVEAWRASKPHAQLVFDLPEYETDLITTYTSLPELHLGLNLLVRGYSSESEGEVDIVNVTMHDFDKGDEIMMVLSYPYLSLEGF